MRPINLKIKGLNSFIEAQEVDFEKLTEKGLFGIFGPTGSGKSTILDGITLALYGEVSRNSTNYMNTNCDSMNVSYEFQMIEKDVKRYRVDREFKRDNKTGNVRTKSAKILDITHDELVLEDKPKQVTEKCEEIIGLKLEDFTRTVVLPQGKFSEFLKLTGKDRRDMLERLFNLQKYGDGLSFKLRNKIYEEFQKSNVLEGELNSYQDVSDEILEEKNKSHAETKLQLERCRIELDEAEKSFVENKELWGLQNELNNLKLKENSLKEKEEKINENKQKLAKGESLLNVKPYVDGYENTNIQIDNAKNEITTLTIKAEIIKEDKKKSEELLEKAKNKKDNELPLLKVKEQKVLDAIEEKKALDILIEEEQNLENDILQLDQNLSKINRDIELKENNIINITDNINNKESITETLNVPEEFKNKVNDGFVILNACEVLNKQINKMLKDKETISLNIKESMKKSDFLSKTLNEKIAKYKDADEQLIKLNDNCPGNQNTLLALNEKHKNAKDKWDKHKEFSDAMEKSLGKIEVIKKTLKQNEYEKISLVEKMNKAKEIINENLAHTLREELSEGEACPVCGSKEHHKENIINISISSNQEQLKQELKGMEERFSKLTAEIAINENNINTEERNINDNETKLMALGDDYKSVSVDILQKEFDKIVQDVNIYNSEKTSLEKRVKILYEEKNNLLIDYNEANSILNNNRELLKKLQDDINSKNDELKEEDKKLIILKTELQIDDFKSVRAEVMKKDNEKATLEKEIRTHRDDLKKEQLLKEKSTSEFTELKINLKEKKTTALEKAKNINEKKNSIINKAGTAINLEDVKEKINVAIKDIENQFIDAEKKKNDIEELYNNLNSKIISSQGNLVSLNERIVKDKEKLDKVFAEEGIKDIEEVKNNFITKAELEKIKVSIEEYNNSLAQLTGAMTNLIKKINNRVLTEEQWNQVQNIKNEKTEKLKLLQEECIGIETELKSIVVKLEVKKDLLKNKEELDYKLDLLNDLEKLFRGKKFVEFVAANQLKYVSIEASKKLNEITSGTYGLEVDEDGKFIIRDYKNGGAQRDASTLSGGETFVASLALALALSSQIQLKGTSPLELFFLDEGFGTLDDNLLDVVMNSLEKIHNDKLSIGIISHVESIKDRVPIKLIVSPAVAGMGGSKVRIEIS